MVSDLRRLEIEATRGEGEEDTNRDDVCYPATRESSFLRHPFRHPCWPGQLCEPARHITIIKHFPTAILVFVLSVYDLVPFFSLLRLVSFFSFLVDLALFSLSVVRCRTRRDQLRSCLRYRTDHHSNSPSPFSCL
jgi:hypothetical protein